MKEKMEKHLITFIAYGGIVEKHQKPNTVVNSLVLASASAKKKMMK
jgi:hypothetical protein